jgi:hypothetical protein
MSAAPIRCPPARPWRTATPRAASLFAAIVAVLSLSACARPVGDFGRAAPSVLNDTIMPRFGEARARGTEPFSGFALTDIEAEMADRIWRFVKAPNAGEWGQDFWTEMERARLSPHTARKFGPQRYYRYLVDTRFESSPIRYDHMRADIQADLAMLPDAFATVCAVREVDRQRAEVVAEFSRLEPWVSGEVLARRRENEAMIAWFTRGLHYRQDSYDYALDHLLAATPHDNASAVDELLGHLAIWTSAAERGEFCGAVNNGPGQGPRAAVPGRVLIESSPTYRK